MTCDSAEVEQMLSFFTGDQVQELYKKALGAVAAQHKQTVKEYFTQAMATAARPSQHGYKDRLLDAVRISKVEAHGDEVTTKVHVMGVRSAGSGTFRARFFEGGTKERTTKSGHKRGHIEALGFFSRSESALDNLRVSLDETLNRLIEKNLPK